jgi:hypothetical protein
MTMPTCRVRLLVKHLHDPTRRCVQEVAQEVVGMHRLDRMWHQRGRREVAQVGGYDEVSLRGDGRCPRISADHNGW